MAEDEAILAVLGEVKKLAQEYRKLTGKPLSITGEVAEYELHVSWVSNSQPLGRQATMLLRERMEGLVGSRSRAGVYSTTANLGSAWVRSESRKSGTRC